MKWRNERTKGELEEDVEERQRARAGEVKGLLLRV